MINLPGNVAMRSTSQAAVTIAPDELDSVGVHVGETSAPDLTFFASK